MESPNIVHKETRSLESGASSSCGREMDHLGLLVHKYIDGIIARLRARKLGDISIVTHSQGTKGNSRGCNKPEDLVLLALFFWHIWHMRT